MVLQTMCGHVPQEATTTILRYDVSDVVRTMCDDMFGAC